MLPEIRTADSCSASHDRSSRHGGESGWVCTVAGTPSARGMALPRT